MKYINFNQKEQQEFMKRVKSNSNLTWKAITQSLGLSRSMIFFYLNGKSKIPTENYEKLCKIAMFEPNNLSPTIIKNKTQNINAPEQIDERLAEFIGLLAGDGHVSRINYEISVTCHKRLDKDYVTNRVSKLFLDLFSLNAAIRESKINNVIKCSVHSKLLSEYLTTNFLIPRGKKKGKLHIPTQIRAEKGFLMSYIRGLFDTDGSIYCRRKKSLVVSIASRDPVFLNEVKNALIELGYSASVSGKNLYIYNQEQINRFMREVKPSNMKHLNRYDNFIKELRVNKDVAPVV